LLGWLAFLSFRHYPFWTLFCKQSRTQLKYLLEPQEKAGSHNKSVRSCHSHSSLHFSKLKSEIPTASQTRYTTLQKSLRETLKINCICNKNTYVAGYELCLDKPRCLIPQRQWPQAPCHCYSKTSLPWPHQLQCPN